MSGNYDPDIGRFISEDPLGLGAGINQYAFGGADPINAFDPSGTDGCVVLCTILFNALAALVASEVNRLAYAGVDGPCPEMTASQAVPHDPYWCIGRLVGGRGSDWGWFGVGLVVLGIIREAVSRSHSAFQSRAPCSNFNPTRCGLIHDVLGQLEGSRYRLCRAVVPGLRSLLQQGIMRWNPDLLSFGETTIRWPDNGAPVVDLLELGPDAFFPGELANTLAHEGYHVLDPGGPHNHARAVGRTCGREIGI